MRKPRKDQVVEGPDELKAAETARIARAEQAEAMKERGETVEKIRALEPDAQKVFNTAAADGLPFGAFMSYQALEEVARKQGKPLSMEQLAVYAGEDETMEEGGTVCWLCAKPVMRRKWAVSSKGQFIIDRESADGGPLLVAAVVKRYDSHGEPFVAPACGGLFTQDGSPDRNSCLAFTREVRELGEGGKPVFFVSSDGRRRPLRLGLYGRIAAEVEAEKVRRTERMDDRQARLNTLGGIVNRQRGAGGQHAFDPQTPRGQRRDGGLTPHNPR